MAFKNPKIVGGEIVAEKQIFCRQLSTDDESVASKGQALSSISSCFGVENQHRVRAMPFPLWFIEVVLLIFQIRIDTDGNDQWRGVTTRHARN